MKTDMIFITQKGRKCSPPAFLTYNAVTSFRDRAHGGGHGSARPVITLVLILLTPVLFVSFILFYFYILYRCKLFLLPCGWILLCVLMV